MMTRLESAAVDSAWDSYLVGCCDVFRQKIDNSKNYAIFKFLQNLELHIVISTVLLDSSLK